jgi:hypothetical protein
VLALRKDRKDILSNLANGNIPLLLRSHDEENLRETAKKCLEIDYLAEDIYKIINNSNITEYKIKLFKWLINSDNDSELDYFNKNNSKIEKNRQKAYFISNIP